MNKLFKKFPAELQYLIRVYLSGIAAFTLLRIILVCMQHEHASEISIGLLARAFFMGFRFDTVVSCYLLVFPALLLSINLFINKNKTLLFRVSNVLLILLYSTAFFVSCVDILYYNHFLTRLTISVLNWTNSPLFMLKIVFQDWINYVFITLLILLIYFIRRRIKYIYTSVTSTFKRDSSLLHQNNYLKNIVFAILIVPIVLLGIRGRVALKSPILWGTAFISDNNFANQLGLNPVFTFFKSYVNSKSPENVKVNFIDNQQAIKTIRESLGIKDTNRYSSPIARKIIAAGAPLNANVVIVMMESMGLSKMKLDNNPVNMTPYLDSIAKVSYTFTNVFSAGIHTYNGVYATLFGMPALMNQHPMLATESITQPFTGIAYTLNQFNYQSVFICPHDEQFDNMAGFLSYNGFQKIVGEKDFPSGEINNTMGVPDDVLFDHAINVIGEMAKSPKPFLASILTGSDHEPIYIPEDHGFVPKTKERKQQVVEYADWSINKFLKMAQKQPWFDNTIFVFVADHGSWYRDCYEMNIYYHKEPFIIYAPKLIKPAMDGRVGAQVDVFPTVMGLLNRTYINNTLGVDLLKEGRKYAAFSADDRLGSVNAEFFWYHNYSAGNEYLLHYTDRDPNQYINKWPTMRDDLKLYAESYVQTAQWLIDNRKVGPQK